MDNKTEDYLMLSGIQHFEFCKRQWALIHVEQQWDENAHTLEGKFLHEKADKPFIKERRGNKLIVRGLPIKSHKLRLVGVCDVVEFIRNENGIKVFGVDKKYLPYPVEYKKGKPKKSDADLLQLTAQAMCLEEMLLCKIKFGYMYYHAIRKRIEIPIDQRLRQKVKQITKEMYHYFSQQYTPRVKTGPFCRRCSLKEICLPSLLNRQTVKEYIDRMLDS